MKKLTIILILFIITFSGFAQEQPRYVYCIVVGSTKFISNKVTIRIDFGENISSYADMRMKDPKTGKPLLFNTIVDALNFMGKQGWELVQVVPEMTNGSTSYFNYVMKKPFSELDQETQMQYMKD